MGFHLSPLHPRLMYLPLLFLSPVQHTVAQQGSLFWARDVEYWQLSVNRGVNCAHLAWPFVGHHWFWWCIFAPCLPALVRVIINTIVVPASLLTSGPAYTTATCAGAAAISCTACGFLAHFGSVCQLQTLTIRGVLIPIDFGHWDLLSVLLLEVGDEFSHLVGTPTLFCKSFLQSSCKPWLMKKVAKVSVVVTWAGLVGRVR